MMMLPKCGAPGPVLWLLCAACLLWDPALAKTVSLQWAKGKSYSALSLTAGDKIAFKWSGATYNVVRLASLAAYTTCSFSGAKTLAARASSRTYTTPALGAGMYYYACSVGNHCKGKQRIRAVVKAKARDYQLTWADGSTNGGQPLSIKAGDSVTFNWNNGKPHDVMKLPSLAALQNCDDHNAGAVRVADMATSGAYKATFSSKGTFYYICSVGAHCAQGQWLIVNVS